mgnify:CR=1 FL=1
MALVGLSLGSGVEEFGGGGRAVPDAGARGTGGEDCVEDGVPGVVGGVCGVDGGPAEDEDAGAVGDELVRKKGGGF